MTAIAAQTPTAQAGKFLSFRLGADEYGVEILKVQEIVGGKGIVRVPRAPAAVRGLVDLRGRRIPVLDVRTCLHLPRGTETEKACIIVADVVQDGRTGAVGLLVDEVCEVLNLRQEEIHEAPRGGGGLEETDFIHGLGRLPDRDVVLVDVQGLLNPRDLEAIAGLTH
jgi:purine-binding chemotaxis protein CheW